MADIEPCPSCGALPCDWVDNPLTQSTTQKADNAALVERAARRIGHEAIHKEARRRTMNDATGSGYDHHSVIVAAEHGIRAALQANTDGETGE